MTKPYSTKKRLVLQCEDCGDLFTTAKSVMKHSRPKVCVEWHNHQMGAVSFRVYTKADHKWNLRWNKEHLEWEAGKAERDAELEAVRESGHFDMPEDVLRAHLHEAHNVPNGPCLFGRKGDRLVWNEETCRDMHEFYHLQIIETDWHRSHA